MNPTRTPTRPRSVEVKLTWAEFALLEAAVQAAVAGDLETDLSFYELDQLGCKLGIVRDYPEGMPC